jgi:hypothetical protein
MAGEAGAQSANEEPKPTIFDNLHDAGFSLRRTIDGPVKPATFGYSHEGGEDFLSTQFALLYHHGMYSDNANELLVNVASEANLSGQYDDRVNNFYRINAFGQFLHAAYGDSRQEGTLIARLGPVYESTKNGELQNLYGEMGLTGTYKALAMGAGRDIAPGVAFMWQPTLLLDLGGNLDRGVTTVEQSDTVARVIPSVGGTLSFYTLAKYMGLAELNLTSTFKESYAPKEANRTTYDYYEVGFDVGITKNLSISTTYKNGREAPTYVAANSFEVMLGLKFGN